MFNSNRNLDDQDNQLNQQVSSHDLDNHNNNDAEIQDDE